MNTNTIKRIDEKKSYIIGGYTRAAYQVITKMHRIQKLEQEAEQYKERLTTSEVLRSILPEKEAENMECEILSEIRNCKYFIEIEQRYINLSINTLLKEAAKVRKLGYPVDEDFCAKAYNYAITMLLKA